jgi:hypothetical protein
MLDLGARARRPLDGSSAVSAVVGTVIVAAIAVGLSVIVWMAARPFTNAPHQALHSAGSSQFEGGAYTVKALGPDDIPLAGGKLLLVLDGIPQTRPLTDLAPQVRDGKVWHVGETVCIAGPPPCLVPNVKQVEASVATRSDVVFSFPPLTSPPKAIAPVFAIASGGGIDLLDAANVRMDVVGTSITYGAGGPPVPITAKLSLDGGDSYTQLFSGSAVAAGNNLAMTGMSAGPRIGLQAYAHYGSFSATYDSMHGDAHVWTLKNGDAAPSVPAFGGQAPLATYLAPYVNTANQTMVLQPNQAILLFEFTSNLNSSAADFQDLVALFTFT